MEIDGASNNGVDSVRDLRDGVVYAPSSGKFKVYIIDEVHMLSTPAFNALLKTLEEPPAHVIFLLATTEIQKIPATILSRTQRFEFRKIPTRQITDHLKSICHSENLPADDDALWLVAAQAQGSMRDSQSILEQLLSFANGQALTTARVSEILGLTDRGLLFSFLQAWTNRDATLALSALKQFSSSGGDPLQMSDDLLRALRDMIVLKSGPENPQELLDLPDSEVRKLQGLSEDIGTEDLHLLFDMCLKGASEVRKSQHPNLVWDVVVLRVLEAPRVVQLQSLISNNRSISAVSAGRPLASTDLKASPTSINPPGVSTKKVSELANSPTGKLDLRERWFQLVQNAKQTDALLAAKLDPLVLKGIENNKLHLSVPPQMGFLLDQLTSGPDRDRLIKLLRKEWGETFDVQVTLEQQGKAGVSSQSMSAEREKRTQDEKQQKALLHPKVVSAAQAFGGVPQIAKPNSDR